VCSTNCNSRLSAISANHDPRWQITFCSSIGLGRMTRTYPLLPAFGEGSRWRGFGPSPIPVRLSAGLLGHGNGAVGRFGEGAGKGSDRCGKGQGEAKARALIFPQGRRDANRERQANMERCRGGLVVGLSVPIGDFRSLLFPIVRLMAEWF